MKTGIIFPQPLTMPETRPVMPTSENLESFGQVLNDSLKELNQTQLDADQSIKEFLSGNLDDIHQVSIALGEAKFTMDLAIEVRNKFVEVYQEMMRMQV